MGVDGVELLPEDEASSLEDSLHEDSREEFSSEEFSELVGAEDSGEEAVSSPDELLKTEAQALKEADADLGKVVFCGKICNIVNFKRLCT